MNSLKRILSLAVFVLLALPVNEVLAQQLKVGFTDPDLLISAMPEYRQIQQQLQQEYQTSQQALQSLAADFQDKLDKYQKQQPLLSAESRATREAELQQLQQEIEASAAQKDEELNQRQVQLLEPLLDKVQTAIDEVAAEKGLDMVVRSPILLFVNENTVLNITEDVARKLGLPVDDTAASN